MGSAPAVGSADGDALAEGGVRAASMRRAEVVRSGLIVDYSGAQNMVREMMTELRDASPLPIMKGATSYPPQTEYANIDATRYILEGAGLEVLAVLDEPTAANQVLKLENGAIVDVGGGTTEVAVISLGGVVVSSSIRIAGDELDRSIIDYARRRFNLQIGERTSERIKITIGAAHPQSENLSTEMRGMDQVTGLPKVVEVTTEDIREAMSDKIEEEIAELPADEQQAFLDDLGIAESGLTKFVHAVYGALDMHAFFTANDHEVHAWTVPPGTTAVEAAGKVHTDMARGFIRAEVLAFDDLKAAGSPKAAKEAGHLRIEAKEYVVGDGDVIYFRFSV